MKTLTVLQFYVLNDRSILVTGILVIPVPNLCNNNGNNIKLTDSLLKERKICHLETLIFLP